MSDFKKVLKKGKLEAITDSTRRSDCMHVLQPAISRFAAYMCSAAGSFMSKVTERIYTADTQSLTAN